MISSSVRGKILKVSIPEDRGKTSKLLEYRKFGMIKLSESLKCINPETLAVSVSQAKACERLWPPAERLLGAARQSQSYKQFDSLSSLPGVDGEDFPNSSQVSTVPSYS